MTLSEPPSVHTAPLRVLREKATLLSSWHCSTGELPLNQASLCVCARGGTQAAPLCGAALSCEHWPM